jgi:glycerol-3-phosphate acyltransferase PlsY
MVDLIYAGLAMVFSYFLGCLCTGFYLVRAVNGKDIRTHASGNVGAKNVGRMLGAPGFIVALLGDTLKGALAVAMTVLVAPWPCFAVFAMIVVVLGHLYPVQLGFRGGKGAATALGALLVLDYKLALLLLAVFLIVMVVTRTFSAAGLVATALSPAAAIIATSDLNVFFGVTTVVLLVLVAHKRNIKAIIRRIGDRRKQREES